MNPSLHFLLAFSSLFATHGRSWQVGKIVDSDTRNEYAVPIVPTKNTQGLAHPIVLGAENALYGAYAHYWIDGPAFSYEVSGFAGGVPTSAQTNVIFAEGGGRWLYLLDGRRNEYRLKIRKRIERESGLTGG